MLTKRPEIFIALPPKRSPRRKAKATLILTSRIVDNRPKPGPPEEIEASTQAADRLWQELVQRTRIAPEQPSKPRQPKL